MCVQTAHYPRSHPTPRWTDKACIDQSNITESLACLPIFLAGCRRLLVVAGPTYVQRLWCVMEIFTFLYMGGELGRITFLPIREHNLELSGKRPPTFDPSVDPKLQDIIDQFKVFDARQARCFIESDRQRLLGVIESGIGSLDAFNSLVRSAFGSRFRS